MSVKGHGLRSREDFQRFCVELRTISHDLDGLVVALHELVASSLPARDKTRFARLIARALGESFPAEAESVASVGWPAEIAMALRRYGSTARRPATSVPKPRDGSVELEPLESPLFGGPSVLFVGDHDELRSSMRRFEQEHGGHPLRIGTMRELDDALDRESVVGIVVGASWWSSNDPPGASPRQRLERLLGSSNLCWLRLVRAPGWTEVEDELVEIYSRSYFRDPTRLNVEDQPILTRHDLGGLAKASRDLTYAERRIRYEFQPTVAQDLIIRAVTSRYLGERYAHVHRHPEDLRVRSLADRGEGGVVGLVSAEDLDVSFVLKVSPKPDAQQEVTRFRNFAHGTGFDMDFFCHGSLGALAFVPIEAKLGAAQSLEDLLREPELERLGDDDPTIPHRAPIESAIASLERFSRQGRTERSTIFCDIDPGPTEAMLLRLGPIVVAGERIDVLELRREGSRVLDRCATNAVCHGDAHPGNILFSATSSAVLIDYECAGLGPAGYDLCYLWIVALSTHFAPVDDEASTTELFGELLRGTAITDLCRRWPSTLGLATNRAVVYLASRAIEASVSSVTEHGLTRDDVYRLVVVVLSGELLDRSRQQLVIRCALLAARSLLRPA